MSQTQSTLKDVTHGSADEQTPETPDVRRSEVAQVVPLPGVDRFGDWDEWQEVATVVEDGVVAAINGEQYRWR